MNTSSPKRKLVPDHVKAAIKHYAANSDCTQKRIAELTGTSERTVYRVLQEAGLLTHMPRMTVEADKAMRTLKAWGIAPGTVEQFLSELQETGMLVKGDASKQAQIVMPAPTRGLAVKHLTEMEEGTWAQLLKDVIQARTAKQFNVGVQTAMLNLSNAVDKNAKPDSN
jgi:hypothetical protein